MGTQQVFTFQQQALLNFNDFRLSDETIKKIPEHILKEKKRIRPKKPTYTKSYDFYHINPETNEIQFNGDEKHIFRIRNLHNIYSKIFNYLGINPLEFSDEEKDKILVRGGLNVWLRDMQAEIPGTEMLNIQERLKIHIKLLRLLKKGFTPENVLIYLTDYK